MCHKYKPKGICFYYSDFQFVVCIMALSIEKTPKVKSNLRRGPYCSSSRLEGKYSNYMMNAGQSEKVRYVRWTSVS